MLAECNRQVTVFFPSGADRDFDVLAEGDQDQHFLFRVGQTEIRESHYDLATGLFRMGDDLLYPVRIVCDRKIEAPVFVHTGLPHIVRLVILLGVERRMQQVIHKEPQLFLKGPLPLRGASVRESIAPADKTTLIVLLS